MAAAGGRGGAGPQPQQQQQQQPAPNLFPNTLDSNGMIDANWFKVVVTKCPSGRHEGSASVVFDRHHGLWDSLPAVFITSVLNATCHVPVQELILKRHKLSSLPKNFSSVGQLPASLTMLDLSGNRFSSLPLVICELIELKELYLAGNQLSSLPDQIRQLTNLNIIDMQQNVFEVFPLPLCSVSTLSIVNLECNRIHTVPPEIQRLSSLRELYLKSNRLSMLPDGVALLHELEILHLSDNLLLELPQNIAGLHNLAQLYLAGNKLRALPTSLLSLTLLRGLTVGGNPLEYPPLRVCRQGVHAIMRYLQENACSSNTESIDQLTHWYKLWILSPLTHIFERIQWYNIHEQYTCIHTYTRTPTHTGCSIYHCVFKCTPIFVHSLPGRKACRQKLNKKYKYT